MPEVKESKSALMRLKEENEKMHMSINLNLDDSRKNGIISFYYWVEKQTRPLMSRENILNNLEFYGHYIICTDEKPSARSLCTFTLVGHKIFMYGGINGDILNEIWSCNISEKYQWTNITKTFKKEQLPNPRFGHSAAYYHQKNEIYFYGGRIKETDKPKEDIVVFNIATGKLTTETCICKSELAYRRNHIAESVGNFMFIHGGIDDNGKILNDSWLLDYQTLKWQRTEIKIPITTKLPALANHASCLVVSSEIRTNSNFHIYKSSDFQGLKSNVKKVN